jgi:uncharacterized protein (TIGR02270 family)
MSNTQLSIIIEQHLDEAIFLWLLRDSVLEAPNYDISDLVLLDYRIVAHIDGLYIAWDKNWDACRRTLAIGEADEVFVAAILAFESGYEAWTKELLEIGSGDMELSRGIVSALGWLSYPKVESFIRNCYSSDSTKLRRIGAASYAIHRQDPGTILHGGLNSHDIFLKARTLKAIGELGKTDFAAALQDHFAEGDEKCRFYAAWSSGLLGSVAGAPVLQAIAQTQGPYAERACIAALRRMSIAEGLQWQRTLAGKDNLSRLAIVGAGAIGDPVLIPWLIEFMAVPEMARVAGESFSMITGIDLAYEDLEGEWPEGFEAGPTENPEDEDVEMDPDEDLPWPEPVFIQEWWHKNKTNFKSGVRHLCGKPITEQQCQHVLRYGYQRQRAAAAMEQVMLRPGQPLFNVEAPGWRQQKLLGLKSHL